jgi:hypothetical protein
MLKSSERSQNASSGASELKNPKFGITHSFGLKKKWFSEGLYIRCNDMRTKSQPANTVASALSTRRPKQAESFVKPRGYRHEVITVPGRTVVRKEIRFHILRH